MARRRPHGRLLSTPIAEVAAKLPLSVLRRSGLLRCAGCDFAAFETVEEAARHLGKDPLRVARLLATALSRKRG